MTSKGMDYFNDRYYVYNRRFLTVVGLWPSNKSSKRYMQIICALMVFGVVVQIWILLTSEWKIESIIDRLQILLPNLSFTTAYIHLLYYYKTIKKALEHVATDWHKLASQEELATMQVYASESKLATQTIACAFYVYMIFLIFLSLLRYVLYASGKIAYTELTLPVHSDIFLTNKIVYFGMFLIQLTIIIIGCTVGITHCTTFILFLQHACALFVIVTIRMDQPFKKNEHKFDGISIFTKREEEFDWIVGVIKYNNDAIHFVELIKIIYEKTYIIDLAIVFAFIILDFFLIFRLINLTVSINDAIRFIIYIVGSLLMICAYANLGQRLEDHSIDIHTKCCLIPFYALSIKTQKLFLLLTMRSMKPCNISVRGIAVVSYELFMKIIKVSFSFATICFQMR